MNPLWKSQRLLQGLASHKPKWPAAACSAAGASVSEQYIPIIECAIIRRREKHFCLIVRRGSGHDTSPRLTAI